MSRAFDFGQLVELCRRTHEETQSSAARAADTYLVMRNWLFGWYIVEYEDGGADRSKLYGRKLIERLADGLKASGIRGCSPTNLRKLREFYRAYPEIQQTLSVEFRARLLAKIFHRLQEAGVKRCSTTHLKLCRQFHQQQKQIGQTLSDHFVFPLVAACHRRLPKAL